MKIVFALSEIGLAGGTKIILEYADFLQRRGHDVICLFPRPKPLGLKSRLSRFKKVFRGVSQPALSPRSSHTWNKQITAIQGSAKGFLDLRDFPDADIVIATWWETAEWINVLPSSKGLKTYFVQDHEIFPYQPTDRVMATYRMSSRKIVVSKWLKEVLSVMYGATSTVVSNGIDLDRFVPPPTPSRGVEVGFVWSSTPRKNCTMAIKALKSAKNSLPNLHATVFGNEPCPRALETLDWVEYHERPFQELIPEIYGKCALWLFPSLSEGFGLPILEALACGTPVIATSAGAAPDLINEKNGKLIMCDSLEMSDAIVDFFQISPDVRATMSIAARETAGRWDWNDSAAQFETTIKNFLQNEY